MNLFLKAATISGAIAVTLGAIGTHMLKTRISTVMLDSYKTGIQYQFYHTFALLAVGLLLNLNQSKSLIWAGYLFIIGICVFSGVIYVMAITGIRALGIIPAFGGLILISAWICMFNHCLKISKLIK